MTASATTTDASCLQYTTVPLQEEAVFVSLTKYQPGEQNQRMKESAIFFSESLSEGTMVQR